MEWTINDAKQFYDIESWSEGYFSINSDGEVVAKPNKGEVSISLSKIIQEVKNKGVKFPFVIRFHDILRNQVKELNDTFYRVIKEANYNAKYMGVYPIKVNQMREVVEEIVDAGKFYLYGLEAGSKAEMLATLAYNTNTESLTILNGYKDREYLKLALLGLKLSRKIFVIIEKVSELLILIDLSRELKIKPLIGIRVKLGVKYSGKWSKSSGEKSKFGLSSSEILETVKILKKEKLLDCLKLMHFHIGSQISDIKTIKEAINEAGIYYTKMYIDYNCPLEYLDVGGGLAIDYDGSKTSTDSSKNYSLIDYAEDVVWGIKQICDMNGVPHPNIISESGRAIVAHHSCVVTNVIGKTSLCENEVLVPKIDTENKHLIIQKMILLCKDLKITLNNYQNIYNEIVNLKEESYQAFKLGLLSLEEKAFVEQTYSNLTGEIYNLIKDLKFFPESMIALDYDISSQYLCNFSVFQSTADHWAIDQLLPIMPIERLNEKPTVEATLVDLTCDSDGKIDKFISKEGEVSTLTLHELQEDEDYVLGIFLTGAYQDVMGDTHNLFGRLTEVHVYLDSKEKDFFYVEEIIQGNSSAKVLSSMQYNCKEMSQILKRAISKSISNGGIGSKEGIELADFYNRTLNSYTYYSD